MAQGNINTVPFARRMVSRMVNAARKANHASVREQDADDRECLRELARMNIQGAKESKRRAREQGAW